MAQYKLPDEIFSKRDSDAWFKFKNQVIGSKTKRHVTPIDMTPIELFDTVLEHNLDNCDSVLLIELAEISGSLLKHPNIKKFEESLISAADKKHLGAKVAYIVFLTHKRLILSNDPTKNSVELTPNEESRAKQYKADFLRLSLKDNIPAILGLYYIFFCGITVEENPAQALAYLEKAQTIPRNKHPFIRDIIDSHYTLNIIWGYYRKTQLTPEEKQISLDATNNLAELGNKNSLYAIRALTMVHCKKEKLQEAFIWLKKGSNLFDPSATALLGFYYLHGQEGIEKNVVLALIYLRLVKSYGVSRINNINEVELKLTAAETEFRNLIAQSPTHLNLSDKNLGDKEILILCDILIMISKLESIDISNNRFSDEGLQAICDAIVATPNAGITALNVSNTCRIITDIGVKALTRLVNECKTLTRLAFNNITFLSDQKNMHELYGAIRNNVKIINFHFNNAPSEKQLDEQPEKPVTPQAEKSTPQPVTIVLTAQNTAVNNTNTNVNSNEKTSLLSKTDEQIEEMASENDFTELFQKLGINTQVVTDQETLVIKIVNKQHFSSVKHILKINHFLKSVQDNIIIVDKNEVSKNRFNLMAKALENGLKYSDENKAKQNNNNRGSDTVILLGGNNDKPNKPRGKNEKTKTKGVPIANLTLSVNNNSKPEKEKVAEEVTSKAITSTNTEPKQPPTPVKTPANTRKTSSSDRSPQLESPATVAVHSSFFDPAPLARSNGTDFIMQSFIRMKTLTNSQLQKSNSNKYAEIMEAIYLLTQVIKTILIQNEEKSVSLLFKNEKNNLKLFHNDLLEKIPVILGSSKEYDHKFVALVQQMINSVMMLAYGLKFIPPKIITQYHLAMETHISIEKLRTKFNNQFKTSNKLLFGVEEFQEKKVDLQLINKILDNTYALQATDDLDKTLTHSRASIITLLKIGYFVNVLFNSHKKLVATHISLEKSESLNNLLSNSTVTKDTLFEMLILCKEDDKSIIEVLENEKLGLLLKITSEVWNLMHSIPKYEVDVINFDQLLLANDQRITEIANLCVSLKVMSELNALLTILAEKAAVQNITQQLFQTTPYRTARKQSKAAQNNDNVTNNAQNTP